MKIITNRPVINNNSSADGEYSGLDGKSPSKQILFFQNWVNKFKGEKLKADGKWGSKTAGAWKRHGAAFEKAANDADAILTNVYNPKSGGGATPTEANAGRPNINKLKGLFAKGKDAFNKAKENGLVDKAKNKLGLGQGGSTESGGNSTEYSSTPESSSSTGMPKGLKIGITVALGLGAIFLIYKVTKKK
ncbi:MAG: hypothetical protein V4547_17855 [Bacteroidota bacterium]